MYIFSMQLHYYKQGKHDEFVRLLEASRTGTFTGFRSRGGKRIEANFEGGGNPHITYREGQFPREGGTLAP